MDETTPNPRLGCLTCAREGRDAIQEFKFVEIKTIHVVCHLHTKSGDDMPLVAVCAECGSPWDERAAVHPNLTPSAWLNARLELDGLDNWQASEVSLEHGLFAHDGETKEAVLRGLSR